MRVQAPLPNTRGGGAFFPRGPDNPQSAGASKFLIPNISPTCSWRGAFLTELCDPLTFQLFGPWTSQLWSVYFDFEQRTYVLSLAVVERKQVQIMGHQISEKR
jgi:hypothetical protein